MSARSVLRSHGAVTFYITVLSCAVSFAMIIPHMFCVLTGARNDGIEEAMSGQFKNRDLSISDEKFGVYLWVVIGSFFNIAMLSAGSFMVRRQQRPNLKQKLAYVVFGTLAYMLCASSLYNNSATLAAAEYLNNPELRPSGQSCSYFFLIPTFALTLMLPQIFESIRGIIGRCCFGQTQGQEALLQESESNRDSSTYTI